MPSCLWHNLTLTGTLDVAQNLTSPCLQLATSEMWCWSGGGGILKKNSLCYSIVSTKLWAVLTGQLTVSGFDLAWFSSLSSECLSVFSLHGAIYILFKKNLLTSLYLFVSWAWCDWPLKWLTNRRPSVLWHCWLGHLSRKIVSVLSANVKHYYTILWFRTAHSGSCWQCSALCALTVNEWPLCVRLWKMWCNLSPPSSPNFLSIESTSAPRQNLSLTDTRRIVSGVCLYLSDLI